MAHLQNQQVLGRKVCILTGNIGPMIRDFCDKLGLDLIATNLEEGPQAYTGMIAGAANLDEEKRKRLIEVVKGGRERSQQELQEIKYGVIGVGNSKYDIPFLEEVGRAFLVRPGSKLRRFSHADSYIYKKDGNESNIHTPASAHAHARIHTSAEYTLSHLECINS